MRFTFISLVIFMVVFVPVVGCSSSKAPQVEYEDGEKEGAEQTTDVSPADMAKLRTWQPGSTAGNNIWSMSVL